MSVNVAPEAEPCAGVRFPLTEDERLSPESLADSDQAKGQVRAIVESDGQAASSKMIERGALRIGIGRDPQACVIRLEGELDLDSARSFEAELRRAEGSAATTIVVDLSELRFIDSAGISVLVRAAERSRANSGRLGLLRGPAQIERVFELCRLEEILHFLD